ncbi:hypothetical protein B4N84_22305 [Flavobacterium sp. IR1]|nr:hypothetical protein B4N84_22305 [Flavobacterium sp. IR1]
MTIEKATANDNEILTVLTKKSKAYWGYSEEQIEMWSEVLTISKEYIATKSVYKLVVNNEIVGYYSFFHESEETIELDNLFVWPDFIGKGFGQILMKDFLLRLENSGIKKVVLDAEPKAEKFYEKIGFVKVGEMETSIKDRFLPKMELLLDSRFSQ